MSARYQKGCLTKLRRSDGADRWQLRWNERSLSGAVVPRKQIIGLVSEYPERSKKLEQRLSELRFLINSDSPTELSRLMVSDLISHYREKELGIDRSGEMAKDANLRLAYPTRSIYDTYLVRWILPRWGREKLVFVKTMMFEEWLKGLDMANGTKAKLRNIMSALFTHAQRYEWIKENPISLVKQSAKREQLPTVLEVDEIRRLLDILEVRERVLVAVDSPSGFRVSELLALKWGDVDFDAMLIHVRRSIYHQVVNDRCKNTASQREVPMAVFMAEMLWQWRDQSEYIKSDDWVFASPEMDGLQPYWPENLRRRIQAAAKAAGITKQIGFHTFRHTLATLMNGNGEQVKTIQELLRHSSAAVTMNTYTQATLPAKRQAQSKIVEMIRPQSA